MTDPTPLAKQIAREHAPRTSPFPGGLFECACDRHQMFNIDAYAAHIATVTEWAVRERVAAEIVRQKVISYDPRYDEFNDALDFAASIARGEGS